MSARIRITRTLVSGVIGLSALVSVRSPALAATPPRAAIASQDAVPAEVAALLARPISPGTVALLLPHAALEVVQERWREALIHSAPTVRAAAARMVFIAGVAGCGERHQYFGAAAAFGDDGRPAWVAVDPGKLSRGCTAVRHVLAATSVLEPTRLERAVRYRLVTDLDATGARCAGDVLTGSYNYTGRRLAWGQKPVGPTLRREVKPAYTRAALEAKIEGVARTDVVISPAGCAGLVEVVRSVPMLTDDAVGAVQRWEFRPPVIDGQPRAVVATVDLTFALR